MTQDINRLKNIRNCEIFTRRLQCTVLFKVIIFKQQFSKNHLILPSSDASGENLEITFKICISINRLIKMTKHLTNKQLIYISFLNSLNK